MGFLDDGDTLDWEETKKVMEYIRKHGIIQLMNIYKANKDRSNDPMLWGDEIEYILIHIDHDKKSVKLALKNVDVLRILENHQKEDDRDSETYLNIHWAPESASYMVEGTPGHPYSDSLDQFWTPELNMRRRKQKLHSILKSEHETAVTMTSFPRVGMVKCFEPEYKIYGGIGKLTLSEILPDEIVTEHNRYKSITNHVNKRREDKLDMKVPVYQDQKTRLKEISLESVSYGYGLCCLQITFQASDIDNGRYLYDQLAVLAPIMQAISASTACLKGYLLDTDVRWNILSMCSDDRSPEEEGKRKPPVEEKGSSSGSEGKKRRKVLYGKEKDGEVHVIHKSRFDSISWYIGKDRNLNKVEYNDVPVEYDPEIQQVLMNEGKFDEVLATHYAHLFIRDPLVVYKDKVEIDDQEKSDHFENIQSTNWNTVRFKPPPPGASFGWRVEFRPLDIQLTDFENAALSVVLILIARTIKHFNLNMYIPISQVDTNMKTAEKRDAVTNNAFWWKTDLQSLDCGVELMSVGDIMNGGVGKDGVKRKGLLEFVDQYISEQEGLKEETKEMLGKYMELVRKRASGELMTAARWIRKFVMDHKLYNQDSVITEEICYDLVIKCKRLVAGEIKEPLLLGDLYGGNRTEVCQHN